MQNDPAEDDEEQQASGSPSSKKESLEASSNSPMDTESSNL